ncbi:pmp22 family protein [Tieghemostelium lacteum]|uniref:Pmp22 family protein n=1 Tax=Tieghemostelium lacteum TaxID=361077 RepID=A0A151ZA35_TIELA|nr:pmp22 family protein [Tieghemostelium lacteum]|eukprot:KYQ90807.1 pmp22 family protein [Tieghemostelium lacteum]
MSFSFSRLKTNFIWEKYKYLLSTHPVKTKSLTGAVVFAAGDILAQKIEDKHEYKFKRTLMMSSIGCFVIIPQIHYWFKYLDYKIPSKSVLATIGKVTIDQILFCPWMVICNMTSVQILSNGPLNFNFQNCKTKIQRELFPILQRAWMIWPLTNFFLFKYISQDYRLIISNLVSVGWNCILSIASNRKI